jgi:hypothetical protein
LKTLIFSLVLATAALGAMGYSNADNVGGIEQARKPT